MNCFIGELYPFTSIISLIATGFLGQEKLQNSDDRDMCEVIVNEVKNLSCG